MKTEKDINETKARDEFESLLYDDKDFFNQWGDEIEWDGKPTYNELNFQEWFKELKGDD